MSPRPCRRSARHRAAVLAGIGQYVNDIRPVRGRCKGGTKRRPCQSRWAAVRVSLDFRDPARVDRLATLECVVCGRVWRRVRPIAIRSADGYQAVLLDVILPASVNRWYSRGTWHRDGDDALVIRNARLDDVDEAVLRNDGIMDRRRAAKERALQKRAAEDAVSIARLRETLATMDARREAERQDEAAAAAREAQS